MTVCVCAVDDSSLPQVSALAHVLPPLGHLPALDGLLREKKTAIMVEYLRKPSLSRAHVLPPVAALGRGRDGEARDDGQGERATTEE